MTLFILVLEITSLPVVILYSSILRSSIATPRVLGHTKDSIPGHHYHSHTTCVTELRGTFYKEVKKGREYVVPRPSEQQGFYRRCR